MSFINNLRNSLNKMKTTFTNPTLLLELQTSLLKLLAYNYFIVLLIANEDAIWNYTFRDTELSNRLGQALIEPTILTKFGFCFRLLTVIFSTVAGRALFQPTRQKRKFLLPCILWNIYTITALAENILEIVWVMFMLEVHLFIFGSILIVGIFMLAFHSKLTVKALRFYDYLNYTEN